jgi:hypothetical protein
METMTETLRLVKPTFVPPLDPDYRPAVLANRAFQKYVFWIGSYSPTVTSCGARTVTSPGL